MTPLHNVQVIDPLLLSLPCKNWPQTPRLPLTSSNQLLIHPKALSLMSLAEELSKSLLEVSQMVSLGSRKQEVSVSNLTFPQMAGSIYISHYHNISSPSLPPPPPYATSFSSSDWVVGLVINPLHSQFRSGLPTWEDNSLTNCLSDLTLNFLEHFAP